MPKLVNVESVQRDSQGFACNRVVIGTAHEKAQSVFPLILSHSSPNPVKVFSNSSSSEEVGSLSSVVGETLEVVGAK